MIQNNGQYYPENSGFQTAGSGFNPDPPVFSEEYLKKTAEKKKKKQIRNAALVTGIPFLLLILFSLFWRMAFLFMTDNIGITRESLAYFWDNSVNTGLTSVLISVFVFTVFFTVTAKLSGRRISDLVAFEKPKKKTLLPLVTAGFAFCMFANFLNLFFENFFENFGTNYSIGSEEIELTAISFVMSVISTAVIPALIEEYACRGIVFGVLLPFGEGFAVLTSAIIFGVMHGNFEQMPFAFIVGIALGYVRVKTGSVWACILVHFLNNLFSVAVEYSELVLPGNLSQVSYIAIAAIALVAGVLSLFLFSRTDGSLKLDIGNSDIPEAKKYRWYFTSPVIIIAVVGYFIESLKYFY